MIRTITKRTRPNYFMTDDEVKIIWAHLKRRYSSKFLLILSFGLFRGLRIGEAVAINILDFEHDFTKLRIVFEKSHIEDVMPLLPEHTAMIKDYVLKNKHTFKDGYLFPFYSSKQKSNHMSALVYESLFCKIRKEIAKEHPQFLDKTNFKTGYVKYRISFHSCRRWFETRIYSHIKDKKCLSDIMRYLDSSTVDRYIDPYETWTRERDILQGTFDNRILEFSQISKGQMRLTSFYS